MNFIFIAKVTNKVANLNRSKRFEQLIQLKRCESSLVFLLPVRILIEYFFVSLLVLVIVIIALVHVLANSEPEVEIIPKGEENAQEPNSPENIRLEELFLDVRDIGPLVVLFSIINVHSELA